MVKTINAGAVKGAWLLLEKHAIFLAATSLRLLIGYVIPAQWQRLCSAVYILYPSNAVNCPVNYSPVLRQCLQDTDAAAKQTDTANEHTR
jgi:hypothetical protein